VTLFAGGVLALAQLACGRDPTSTRPDPAYIPPRTGTVVVMIKSAGNGNDADGLITSIDQSIFGSVKAGAPIVRDSVKPGNHVIRFQGVAPQCRTSADSILISTLSGLTDTVSVDMTCIGGIAYYSYVGLQQLNVVYLAEDGRTITLAARPGRNVALGWSPDGSQLLFLSEDAGRDHLFIVRSDGTDVRELTTGDTHVLDAHWSPDGSRIAYSQVETQIYFSPDGGPHIFTMDPDGANKRALTSPLGSQTGALWSPDGASLYFACDHFGNFVDICTTSADGSGFRPIRYAVIESMRPSCANGCSATPHAFSVSPDGRSLLFNFYPGTGPTSSFWIGTTDGASAVKLSSPMSIVGALWSPTGDRLALSLWDGALGYAIATTRGDGTGFQMITTLSDRQGGPHWSPDGALIAYTEDRPHGTQIWVMNADGSAARAVTAAPDLIAGPFWNPKAHAAGPLRLSASR
jgi:Tol biopolymer transport system component